MRRLVLYLYCLLLTSDEPSSVIIVFYSWVVVSVYLDTTPVCKLRSDLAFLRNSAHATTREAANFAFTISSFAQPLLEDDEVPLPPLLSMLSPALSAGITVVNTEMDGVEPRRWTPKVFHERLRCMRVSYKKHLEVTSSVMRALTAAVAGGAEMTAQSLLPVQHEMGLPAYRSKDDPFYEPPKDQFLGRALVFLKELCPTSDMHLPSIDPVASAAVLISTGGGGEEVEFEGGDDEVEFEGGEVSGETGALPRTGEVHHVLQLVDDNGSVIGEVRVSAKLVRSGDQETPKTAETKESSGGGTGGAYTGPVDALLKICESSTVTPDMVKVRELIAAGVDLHATDEDGNIALTTASSRGHLDVVKALLEADSSMEHLRVTNKIGKNALSAATNDEIAALIRKAVVGGGKSCGGGGGGGGGGKGGGGSGGKGGGGESKDVRVSGYAPSSQMTLGDFMVPGGVAESPSVSSASFASAGDGSVGEGGVHHHPSCHVEFTVVEVSGGVVGKYSKPSVQLLVWEPDSSDPPLKGASQRLNPTITALAGGLRRHRSRGLGGFTTRFGGALSPSFALYVEEKRDKERGGKRRRDEERLIMGRIETSE